MPHPMKRGRGPLDTDQVIQGFEDDLGPFFTAVETMQMPMLFTDARSAKNNIAYVNQCLLDLTGYDKSDLIGLPFHCLLADRDDRAQITLKIISSLDTSSINLNFLRKDRSKFEAAVLASPVSDVDDNLQQYFVSLFDHSELIENTINEHLRQAEMYRHAPGFIALSDGPDHRFSFANTAYEKLIGRRDFLGQTVADVMPEVANQGLIKLLDTVYHSGERVIGKNVRINLMRGLNGEVETRYVDYIYEPVRDASGAVVGLFCEGSDITEAQEVSEKLNDIQGQLLHVSRLNAMGTMAATLAHEINQPLAAIANYAEACAHVLEESGNPSKKLREGLLAIAAATDRAGKIIIGLRNMTKRTTPVFQVFDLNDALEESVRLVRAGGCEDVSIKMQCARSMFVFGDKIQVQQVIINLLRNACHAAAQTSKAGTVVTRSMTKSGRSCIVVCDNGLGLPTSIVGDVFKWTETTKTDGMGIGLSICRTIADSHGGDITVDKTGPSGTTFTFSLPPLDVGKTEIEVL